MEEEKKTKVDVVLVNPTRVGMDSYCTPPLHLMYLKKALNDSGYSAYIVNVHEIFCKAIGKYDNLQSGSVQKQRIENQAIADILSLEAKVIGIGGVCPSYKFSERLAVAIKAKRKIPVIIGGSLGLPLKELWLKHTEVDFLCEGDGESLIVDLVKNLSNPDKLRQIPGLYWREDTRWVGNLPQLPSNLDSIISPDIRDVDYEFYMSTFKKWINVTLSKEYQLTEANRVWPVVLTRGCIYNCLFCFHFNRKHRCHSIKYIIGHLRRLKNEFGVDVIVTWDDLIMANPKWFMTLCDALAESSLGIKIFSSGGKANLITEEMANKMARANFFRISYGIESGSQKILDEMQKNATVEDNRKAIEVTTKAGIFVHINIVLGMPGETKATLRETYNFLIDIVRRNNLNMSNISCSYATGYPGTQLFDLMVSKGLAGDLREYIFNVQGVGSPEPILCGLLRDELEYFVFRLRSRVNSNYYSNRGDYMHKLANLLLYNWYSYKAKRYVSHGVKRAIQKFMK